MAETLDYLIDTHGVTRALDAYVVGVAFDAAGTAGFALGDGTLRLAATDDWETVAVADGAILAMASAGAGFLCGDDGGGFSRVVGGVARELAIFPGKWVEQVACASTGVVACSVGRRLHLFDADSGAMKTLEHPSTVTGIAFDGRGKRVAVSHYNGASVWFVASTSETPRSLEWKGSHTGVAVHPQGEAVVTAMQENALHGWRLSDGQHMRMSGYPAKTESLSFSRTGKWLASSGADAVVLWPFFGGGPMGKAPMELAGGREILCTRVACHPVQDVCAAGFADGVVVMLDLNTQRVLPVAPASGAAVTALGWSGDGKRLAFGTEAGLAAVVRL